MKFVRENGRTIPAEDRIFALNGRAKAMAEKVGKDKVINATIGALLDDEGELTVLDSVVSAYKSLDGVEFAEYAPIAGLDTFKEAIKKAVLGNRNTDRFVEVVATPGGTGAIRNTVANFSDIGDTVLTSDWFWAPYRTICDEIGRKLDTYKLFNDNRGFNIEAFEEKVTDILLRQECLTIILNTPAHNPTGYSVKPEEWQEIVKVLNNATKNGKQVTLFIDIAYVDFACEDDDEARNFLPFVEKMGDNILPVIGYSASKTFTMYGMRCGGVLCFAKTADVAEEFVKAISYSSRGSWSNSNRSGQAIIANIYKDEKLTTKVDEERRALRKVLIKRGRVFEKEAERLGVPVVPFDAGFFVCVDCKDPEALSTALEKEGVFAVPLAKGLRFSVASIGTDKIKRAVEILAKILQKM